MVHNTSGVLLTGNNPLPYGVSYSQQSKLGVCCYLFVKRTYIAPMAGSGLSKHLLTPVRPHTSKAIVPRELQRYECAAAEFAREQEYLGFGSWTSFIAHCCCMPRGTDAGSVYTELWACPDPASSNNTIMYKERQRRTRNMSSIPFVRSVCGRTFMDEAGDPLPEQEPIWDPASGRFVVASKLIVVTEYW